MTIEKLKAVESTRHFDVLTGLRGIAVIFVVWFHFWQQSWWTPYIRLFGKTISLMYLPAMGFMGVEVFLVLGAFGLFYPYVQKVFEGSSTGSLKRYAYRRVIKIIPSYYVMLVLVIIFGQGTPFMQGKDWWDILRHFLVINNLFRDTLLSSVNSVSWFVGLQMQFYLVFPLIALAFRKRPVLTYLLLQGAGILFRLYVFNYQYRNLSYLFNQLPGYIDMYANGMLAAYLVCLLHNRAKSLGKLKIFFTLASLTSVLIYGMLMKYMSSNTKLGSLQDYQLHLRPFFGWTLVILTVSSIFAFKGWKLVLSNPFTRFMAAISYNLYLWHQWLAVQIRIREFIPSVVDDPHFDENWKVIYSFVITIASLIVAIFFTYCLERPLAKKGLRRYLRDIPVIVKRIFVRKKKLVPEMEPLEVKEGEDV